MNTDPAFSPTADSSVSPSADGNTTTATSSASPASKKRRPSRSATSSTKRSPPGGSTNSLSSKLLIATSPAKPRPSHILLHAVPGWGKTSLAAQAANPLFLMTKNETGLITLIQNGLLPPTPWIQFPRSESRVSNEAESWSEALGAIQTLLSEDTLYKTLCLDTLNGLERLCHERVCSESYKGDWSEKGFLGYQRGYETALSEWRKLLNLLDRLRDEKGIGTFALCHTHVKTQNNPLGADFDRFVPAMHRKTWDLTHGWDPRNNNLVKLVLLVLTEYGLSAVCMMQLLSKGLGQSS